MFSILNKIIFNATTYLIFFEINSKALHIEVVIKLLRGHMMSGSND